MEINLKQGEKLVKIARKAISYYLATGKKLNEKTEIKNLNQKAGVFVTLKTEKNELRGCMGYPFATEELWKAVIDCAINSGFKDPRFDDIKVKELEKIKISVSVLSPMKEIKGKPEDIINKIEIGKTGIFLKSGIYSGLLLPSVAEEFKMNELEFMEATAEKAGLPKYSWKQEKVQKFFFNAKVFEEKEPNGKVEEL